MILFQTSFNIAVPILFPPDSIGCAIKLVILAAGDLINGRALLINAPSIALLTMSAKSLFSNGVYL